MSDTQQCAQAPLTDLLDGIQQDARMVYELGPTHHQFIPVGKLAAAASSRIKELERENAELRATQLKFGKMMHEQMGIADELRAAIRKAADFLDVNFGVGPPSIDAALATLRSAMQENKHDR